MANAVSTAGMLVKYAAETTAGTRPTTGYTEIPGVKALPSLGDEVNTLQSTPLSATKNHTYIAGLDCFCNCRRGSYRWKADVGRVRLPGK